MPALSFQGEWLDMLLSGTKQQTTRQQTDRIKVGDIANVYNQQRRRITDKPLLYLTQAGAGVVDIRDVAYPHVPKGHGFEQYYAHFLGKVKITEVYDIHPCEMTEDELKAWAQADGFKGFHPSGVFPEQLCSLDPGANMWFQNRYGDDWMQQWWTVERWDGWLERKSSTPESDIHRICGSYGEPVGIGEFNERFYQVFGA